MFHELHAFLDLILRPRIFVLEKVTMFVRLMITKLRRWMPSPESFSMDNKHDFISKSSASCHLKRVHRRKIT